jgi:hypothetical protein
MTTLLYIIAIVVLVILVLIIAVLVEYPLNKKKDSRALEKQFFERIHRKIPENTWIRYNVNDFKTHPNLNARYIIYRNNSIYVEQWNGIGWASGHTSITHWMKTSKI